MKFNGFQKMTLLDYPGKVACTLFTAGCNFRCPFCHNALLVTQIDNREIYDEDLILDFLDKRKGLLDGVCVTGGEPLLNPEIENFLFKVKEKGYKIKVDSNGSFPDRLKSIVNNGLADYIAMDIKNCKEKYAMTVGLDSFDLSNIEKSVDFLISSGTDFEFRTTVVKEFHTVDDIRKISEWICGAKRYFLQNFVDSGSLIGESLHPVDKETLETMRKTAEKHIPDTSLRGI